MARHHTVPAHRRMPYPAQVALLAVACLVVVAAVGVVVGLTIADCLNQVGQP